MITRPRRNRRAAIAGVALLAGLLLAACSGSTANSWTYGPMSSPQPATSGPSVGPSEGPGSPPPSGGQAAGTVITITARNISFEPKQLQAPANVPFTIHFDNEDGGIPHDVTIRNGTTGGAAVFTGDPITGVASTDYHVPPLPPGTYMIVCTIHPSQMIATLIVK